MSNEHEEQVPGVTLYLARTHADSRQHDVTHYELTLDAWVNDEETWKVVQAKFVEGMRVFTVPDFHLEVLDVLRAELKEARDRVLLLERQVAQEQDAHELTRIELARLKEPLLRLGRALGR